VLADALEKSPTPAKVALLEILGEMGGKTALATLGASAKSNLPELQDAASRLLGRWNGVDAAPVLLDLAKSAPQDRFKVRALRGYISLARRFAMPEAERVAMCQKAMDAASQPADQKLVLEVLALHPSAAGLELVIKAGKNAALKDDATATTLTIAQKLGAKFEDASALLAKAGLERVKLEIVQAQYGAGSTQKDVTATLRKQAGDLPLVSLGAANYNAAFGGDPMPGSVKRLRVVYRINGKQGEATFAENAPIILPMPK
jgi:hypothetical protein